jgi:hypothetical protein
LGVGRTVAASRAGAEAATAGIAAAGKVIASPHPGHFTRLPADVAAALSFLPHVHVTEIVESSPATRAPAFFN